MGKSKIKKNILDIMLSLKIEYIKFFSLYKDCIMLYSVNLKTFIFFQCLAVSLLATRIGSLADLQWKQPLKDKRNVRKVYFKLEAYTIVSSKRNYEHIKLHEI